MKLHVVHLTSVHRADDVRIFRKECLSLLKHGFDVTIVARNVPSLEDATGVRRVLVPVRRGRMARVVRTTLDVVAAALRLDADLYHIHDPELLPAGLFLRWCGRRVVYDAHEDVAKQNLNKAWIPKPFRHLFARAVDAVEKIISSRLSGIVAATKPIGRRFRHRHVAVVQNFPPLPEPSSPSATGADSRRVVYAGGISQARGILPLVEAVNLVRPACILVCAGQVDEAMERQIRDRDSGGRTQLVGWLRADEIAAIYRDAAIGVVTLLPTPAYVESLPIKLFEYMAAGLPVIASDFPAWRPIVEGRGCGICVDPGDPEAIAAAIESLLRDPGKARSMGERGRRAVLEEFNWPTQEKPLVDLYQTLLSDGRNGRCAA